MTKEVSLELLKLWIETNDQENIDEFLDSVILELGYDALTFDEFKNHEIYCYDKNTDSTTELKLIDIFTEEELWFYVDPR